jgi:cytochrome d ubiquinol oxidase subunit I
VEIPRALSFLAFGDPDAEVRGLDAVNRDQWPPVSIVHIGFQVMVALGTYMALLSLWIVWTVARKRDVAANRLLLGAIVLALPMGFLATEAGWTVTEVGRQPWIIQGVLRTADAVTPMPGLIVPFTLFTLLYLFLGVIVVYLLWAQIAKAPTTRKQRRRNTSHAVPGIEPGLAGGDYRPSHTWSAARRRAAPARSRRPFMRWLLRVW